MQLATLVYVLNMLVVLDEHELLHECACDELLQITAGK